MYKYCTSTTFVSLSLVNIIILLLATQSYQVFSFSPTGTASISFSTSRTIGTTTLTTTRRTKTLTTFNSALNRLRVQEPVFLVPKLKMSSSGTGTTSTDPIIKRIQEMGLSLPPAPKAAANYVPVQRCGNILYLSGHLPFHTDGVTITTGRIGELSASSSELTIEYGYNAARQCGLNLIATLNQYLNGQLDNNIVQIIKVFGIVQSTETFHEQHKIINGCSDLLVDIFQLSKRGIHARSAIGTNSLPLNATVEIEMIVQIRDDIL